MYWCECTKIRGDLSNLSDISTPAVEYGDFSPQQEVGQMFTMIRAVEYAPP